jgi:DNA invertase Pin-like site-specific DNA recombinase
MESTRKVTGQRLGYIRVSSTDQNTERQLDGVQLDERFEDKCSGKDRERPALQALLKHARKGDHILVHEMSRLARNLTDMLNLVKELTGRGIVIEFVKEKLVFDGKADSGGMLMLQIMGAVSEFERAMILERQREGIRIAQAKGTYRGRKAALSLARANELRQRAAAGEVKTQLAREFGITRQTLYAYLTRQPLHGMHHLPIAKLCSIA